MEPKVQERLHALMDKNTQGELKPGEANELEQLVDRGQRLTLRKSAAVALLVERGYSITPEKLTPRD